MTTSKSLRFPILLFAVLIWAGCDSADPGGGGVDPRSGIDFQGPELATLTTGSMQNVDYFVENRGLEAIDVEVTRSPEGSATSIDDVGGPYRKKVSLNWNPGSDDSGHVETLAVLARTESGEQALHVFDIYVQ